MLQTLQYIPLDPTNTDHCAVFTGFMHAYIAEMNEHSHRPLPEQYRQKWIDSIIAAQGPKDRHLELCYRNGIPIGFLYGKVDHADHRGYTKPGWGYIVEFYVKPEYRRQGIGTHMYHHLHCLFRNDGVQNLYLTADPITGKPFWEAIGFQNTGERSPDNQLEIYTYQHLL